MKAALEGLVCGVAGGVAGVMAMNGLMRLTRGMVRQRRPRPKDVFATERSMSLVGVQHRPGEPATEALARLAYRRIAGRQPDPHTRQQLGQVVHWGYGLLMAGLYGAIRARRVRGLEALRDGALLGAGMWLAGDELAVPLLGLSDKPTMTHPTRHLQALIGHVGYGVATAATAAALRPVMAGPGLPHLHNRRGGHS